MARAEGCDLLVDGPQGEERHAFASPEEAAGRAAFIREAMSWVGTPFLDCGAVKGRSGGVDCAMLLVRSAVDSGRLAEFDPRPYSPRHMLHSREEKFLDILAGLGAVEVARPRVGDIVVWQFGKTFSHGAVLVSARRVMHAYGAYECALVTGIDEPLLQFWPLHGGHAPRPRRYFDLWAG